MARHLAIFSGTAISDILRGKKTIESRLSRHRIAPFAAVGNGDLVFMKQSGGKIMGQFFVDKAVFFDHPNTEDMQKIRQEYVKGLLVDEQFFRQHQDACYVTLLFIRHPSSFLTAPLTFAKSDRRGWVVID